VLIFEGGKVVIPPLIHDRAAVWDLVNALPAEVRDGRRQALARYGRSTTAFRVTRANGQTHDELADMH
jgi:hypothetical protein